MSQVTDSTSSTNAAQRKQEAYDSEKAEARATHDQEVKRLKEESAQEIARVKNDYGKQFDSERTQARGEVKRLKEELYDQSGKNSSQDSRDRVQEHNQVTRFAEDLKSETKKKVDQVEKNADQRTIRQQDGENQKIEDALAAQKKSERQEMSAIEQEVNQYRNSGRDLESEKAQVSQKLNQENETTNQAEKKRIIEGYERQIAKLKNDKEEMGNHFNDRLVDTVNQVNQSSKSQIRRQKDEFTDIAKEDIKERWRLADNYQGDIKNLSERQSRDVTNLIAKTADDQIKANTALDNTYQNYISAKSEQQNQQMGIKDQKIRELETNDNPLKASALLTKRIGDTYEKRFNSELVAADDVNQKNLQGTRVRDLADRRALADHYQERFVGLNRDTRREMDVQKKQFFDSYENLDNTRISQVGTLTAEKRADAERLHQKQSLEIVGIQKGKQDALSEQRDGLLREKSIVVDESEQARKLQDREWFMKTNDLRRNLETKMTDERDQHEKVVSEIKLDFDKKLRDQDRTSKRALDDRIRMYEYQIKQQEVAFREKERFLTEHYEEELDTMRRTNAHLIQKKS